MTTHRIFSKVVAVVFSFVLTFGLLNLLSYFYVFLYLSAKLEFTSWNRNVAPAMWGVMTWDRNIQYHPYWGYSELPEEPMLEPALSDYTVRIIGGSFASDIGRWAVRNPQAVQALVAEIKPGIDPQRVNVINSAHAGYHQPQQLHLVVDHIDNTDLFISFEGYNEMMHEWTKCSPRNWPLLAQFRYDPTFQNYIPYTYFFYRKTFQILMDWREWSLVNVIFYMVGPSLSEGASAQNKKALLKADKTCVERSKYPDDAVLASDWIQALKIQKSIVESQKKRIFVFIQPNQYIADSKKAFSEQEQALFEDWDPLIKEMTNVRLNFAIKEIESQGYLDGTVIDMTQIFAKESQSIYVDACCHINQTGHKIVYEKSLDIIRSKLVSRRINHD